MYNGLELTCSWSGCSQYELTNSPFTINLVPAADPSLPQPFATPAVMQPTTDPYADLFPHAYFPSNDEPLFGAKVTRFSNYDVLGLSWAHVLSDGAGLNHFTRLLSRVDAGGEVGEADWPDYGEHVAVDGKPSREVLERWDTRWQCPARTNEAVGELCEWRCGALQTRSGRAPGPDQLGYCTLAGMDSFKGRLVQFVLSTAEVKRLQQLATGEGPDGFVTEQDAMTSYFANLCRLQGATINKVSNTVSVSTASSGLSPPCRVPADPLDISLSRSSQYRTFHRGHPAFPATLPRLLANVAHLFTHPPFPPSSSAPSAPPSLRPFAIHLRTTLTHLRTHAPSCLAWLATGSLRYRVAEQPLPDADEVSVNSNWGWEWHIDFGMGGGSVAFHTTPPIDRFLRVFPARGGGAELSWLMEEGRAGRVMEEVRRDRETNFARWE